MCILLVINLHFPGEVRAWDCDASPSNQSSFRPVGYGSETHVFSAYTDTIEGRSYIRVIGLTLTDKRSVPPMYCSIRGNLNSVCYRVDASVSVIPENHGYRLV